jgi:hypothetical protein
MAEKCATTPCPSEGSVWVGNGTWDDEVWHETFYCLHHALETLAALHEAPPTDPTAT